MIGLGITTITVFALVFSSLLNIPQSNLSNLTTLAGTAVGYYFGTRGTNKTT